MGRSLSYLSAQICAIADHVCARLLETLCKIQRDIFSEVPPPLKSLLSFWGSLGVIDVQSLQLIHVLVKSIDAHLSIGMLSRQEKAIEDRI
jgi:hypothetical protein